MQLKKRPISSAAKKEYKNSKNCPTSFANQDRMALFAPYVKLNAKNLATKKNPITVKTSFGEVRFENGLLDQTHRDIWQILFTYPNEFGLQTGYDNLGNDLWSFVFTAYQLSKYLGLKNVCKAWLHKKLKEMKDVSFTLKPTKNKELKGHFDFGEAYTSILHDVVIQKQSGKFYVTISPFFLQCYMYDTAIHSEKLTAQILKIKEAYIKALVYHIITHQNFHRHLEDLMVDVGLPTKNSNLKEYNRYKNLITKQDNLKLMEEDFQICLVKDPVTLKWRVRYNQTNKVWADNEFNQYNREQHS